MGEHQCTAVGYESSINCVSDSMTTKPVTRKATGSLYLHVSIRPEIDGFTFPKSLHEGQRWNALCSVTKGDPPISIKWYKDGRILGSSSPSSGPNSSGGSSRASSSSSTSSQSQASDLAGIHIYDVTQYSSTLNFDSLRPEHRGNYTCQASNHADSTSSTQELVVHGQFDTMSLSHTQLILHSL